MKPAYNRPKRGFLPLLTGGQNITGWAISAPGRNRTCDLALRRHSLYPLSYRGLSKGRSQLTSGLGNGGGEGDRTLDLRIANAITTHSEARLIHLPSHTRSIKGYAGHEKSIPVPTFIGLPGVSSRVGASIGVV